MDIEIYLPCEPDLVCDGLLWFFTLALIVGAGAFIWVVYKEYKEISKK
jgi:hypothetical protein